MTETDPQPWLHENMNERVDAELGVIIGEPEKPVVRSTNQRLDEIEAKLDALAVGVNTIGEMMNTVADGFEQTMEKVNQGGIGALLGGLMGKNNG